MLGWLSGQFFNITFSGLVSNETRAHYYRKPLARLKRAAPFLYFDSDPYAVAAGDNIVWMVNGMTATDQFPYSRREFLGDKSDERSPIPQPQRRANYVEDSVKATVDAYTGEVRFYRFSDGPIISAWARVYPELFRPKEEMPEKVREQVQYPVQLFHIQFDDVYVYYQMADAMTFFNREDLWDDADEVLGPMLDEGRAITFSIEPYYWIAETGTGVMPAAKNKAQFVQSQVFTPEAARILRAIPTVYQDGEDYGRLVVLQVPKGYYFQGPEQAESIIDQDPIICEYMTLWNRMGNEVIRGHMTSLVIGNEVIYVEPIFIRSKQNSVPQLQRVVVVFRERVAMGESVEEALRKAVDLASGHPDMPGGRRAAPQPGRPGEQAAGIDSPGAPRG